MSGVSGTGRAAARAVGWLAVVSTTVYFLSDVLEASHGGFTTVQLWLTLASEATLPAVVVGLYRLQRPQIGRLGRYGAVAYAVAYVYFTYSVIYALAHGTPDFAALNHALNPAMTVFGAVMVAAGIAFGAAIYHARVLPGWTGPTLAAGVVLVVATLSLPAAVQLTAIGVRDLAFIGMGVAALGSGSGKRPVIPPPAPPSPPSASGLPDGDNAGAGQASGPAGPDGIDLYWLPLGAGGHSVRWNGKFYEALAAWHERRRSQDLYHSALEVRHRGRRYVIEMAPVWNEASPGRGVVCVGPVGARWLGRFRAFRYEVHCWEDGRIPDVLEAVDSPRRLSDDTAIAAAVLQRTREVPALTWGRDELGAGEMWNSNSLVAWLLAGSGHDMAAITPPAHGRAPGWAAGLQLARREHHGACLPHVPMVPTS
jgi:hypothetical protein